MLAEPQDGIFLLPSFLNTSECSALIQYAEGKGFEPAPISASGSERVAADVRNNARVIEDQQDRADALWHQLSSALPPFYQGLQTIGINERFRFYRYDPGEFFAGHIDGSFRRENGERSLLTLMIYLNAEFEGGETRFGDFVVTPQTGMLLLFRHDTFHEGSAVRAGRKYVLRSDVMFNPPGRLTVR